MLLHAHAGEGPRSRTGDTRSASVGISVYEGMLWSILMIGPQRQCGCQRPPRMRFETPAQSRGERGSVAAAPAAAAAAPRVPVALPQSGRPPTAVTGAPPASSPPAHLRGITADVCCQMFHHLHSHSGRAHDQPVQDFQSLLYQFGPCNRNGWIADAELGWHGPSTRQGGGAGEEGDSSVACPTGDSPSPGHAPESTTDYAVLRDVLHSF